MNNTFKIVNVNTATVIKDGLDFLEARIFVIGKDELCLMDTNADVADRLQRRANYIEATKDLKDEA